MSETLVTVNGRNLTLGAAPGERLSAVLRNELQLTGTKIGCDAGDCGACTVLVDGEPGCACLIAVGQVSGCNVVTVEGLRKNGSLSRLQESFLHHGAAQCGICTPGMLLSAAALLEVEPQPSRMQVENALGGVLCRCTGYAKIVDAVVAATGFNGISVVPEAGHNVGAAVRHLDGVGKVTGALLYGADGLPNDCLHVRVIRSPYHHAEFSIGDRAAFLAAHPGIAIMIDATDIPGRNCFGAIASFADQPVFAEKIVRFRGEAVAAIAGSRQAVENLPLDDLPVIWRELEPIMHPAAAMAPDAKLLHANRTGNILTEGLVRRGDAKSALDQSKYRVRRHYQTPFVEHAYIEPEAGHAIWSNNRLELTACTQAPALDREELAAILALPLEDVRVIPSACGGGFGSKLDLSLQPYIALVAKLTGRAASIVYSRPQSMASTTKRHPSEIDIEIGCGEDGKITGMEFTGIFNTGAYASWGPTVANRVPVHASGPYYVPNYHALGRAVHTNCPPSGAFRGFGVPQSAIAQECAFDELADAAGIDRLQFRLVNVLENGMATVTGQNFDKGVGIGECLRALEADWQRAFDKAKSYNRSAQAAPFRKGVGVASCWYGCGNTSLPNPSTIRIGIRRDGTPVLHQGAVDIGQGANTVIAQIAADAFGVPVHAFELINGDTDLTPDAGKTSASRQTYVSGEAARRSGVALRAKLLRHGNVGPAAKIVLANGSIVLDDASNRVEIELGNLPCDDFDYVFSSQETYDPPTKALDQDGQGIPYAVYGYGAQMIELTVDTGLGTVKLDRLTTAHDVGRAINPLLVEGQIEGGAAQGIGMALMEEFHPGRTENLHDYLIPTIGDMPEFSHTIIEVADAEGPYGAKGLGEHTLIPTAPAILNAIRDATGVAIRDLPATPGKILAALRANGGEGGDG